MTDKKICTLPKRVGSSSVVPCPQHSEKCIAEFELKTPVRFIQHQGKRSPAHLQHCFFEKIRQTVRRSQHIVPDIGGPDGCPEFSPYAVSEVEQKSSQTLEMS